MGSTLKFFAGNRTAVQQIVRDVGIGVVCTFETATYNICNPIPVTPTRLLEKCVNVSVAVSGDPTNGNTWVGIMPVRVDRVAHMRGELELQGDMALLLCRGEGLEPAASGVIAYHQGFDGQNVRLTQFIDMEPELATALMRNALSDKERRSLERASPQVIATLNGMVREHGFRLEELA
jgi:hypothetical protein